MADETTAQRIALWGTRIKTMTAHQVAEQFAWEHCSTLTWAARIEDVLRFSIPSLHLVSKELEGRPEATLALHNLFVACMENAARLRATNAPALTEAATILHYVNASADMAAPLEEEHVAALAHRVLTKHREDINHNLIRGHVRTEAPGMPMAIVDILVDEAVSRITNGARLADFLNLYASEEVGLLPEHHTKILDSITDIAMYRDARWTDSYEDHVKDALVSYEAKAKGLTIDHHMRILILLLAHGVDRRDDTKKYMDRVRLSP